jgi:hypothetical protein
MEKRRKKKKEKHNSSLWFEGQREEESLDCEGKKRRKYNGENQTKKKREK